jgi:hypothetical protein
MDKVDLVSKMWSELDKNEMAKTLALPISDRVYLL